MILGIPTTCAHVFHEGRWWSYGPFVRELDELASAFGELHVLAPVDSGPPPEFWEPYAPSTRIQAVPYRSNKGSGLDQRAFEFSDLLPCLKGLLAMSRACDALQVRSPCSIGTLASLIFPLTGKPCFAKYAGQWPDYPGEPRSVRLQKWILRSALWRRLLVFVYGQWTGQADNVLTTFASVINETSLGDLPVLSPLASNAPVVLYVGRLSAQKNVDVLIRSLEQVHRLGIPFQLRIIGSGEEQDRLIQLAGESEIRQLTEFCGALVHDQVLSEYGRSDVLVLASQSEGWSKSIGEAMYFGMSCIGTNRGAVPQMLADGRGLAVEPRDQAALVIALAQLLSDSALRKEMGRKAKAWAATLTLANAVGQVSTRVARHFSLALPGRD